MQPGLDPHDAHGGGRKNIYMEVPSEGSKAKFHLRRWVDVAQKVRKHVTGCSVNSRARAQEGSGPQGAGEDAVKGAACKSTRNTNPPSKCTLSSTHGGTYGAWASGSALSEKSRLERAEHQPREHEIGEELVWNENRWAPASGHTVDEGPGRWSSPFEMGKIRYGVGIVTKYGPSSTRAKNHGIALFGRTNPVGSVLVNHPPSPTTSPLPSPPPVTPSVPLNIGDTQSSKLDTSTAHKHNHISVFATRLKPARQTDMPGSSGASNRRWSHEAARADDARPISYRALTVPYEISPSEHDHAKDQDAQWSPPEALPDNQEPPRQESAQEYFTKQEPLVGASGERKHTNNEPAKQDPTGHNHFERDAEQHDADVRDGDVRGDTVRGQDGDGKQELAKGHPAKADGKHDQENVQDMDDRLVRA
ncbi:uncharacterized protein B0H18DRAFT_1126107 [Fomitopsis serialis]|uniref:uncharacterized protein n=1 Tax=Fomitopsis serialis TaxID=139415 RepID=UPI0020081DDB|nr:uncharacterized protein B0H18DRAFT_1126107 [Neoantrodia serialis]KAH9913615.1 hypothetical protein B0H18DRAFT_1126107 [Neoantrodia serialis]